MSRFASRSNREVPVAGDVPSPGAAIENGAMHISDSEWGGIGGSNETNRSNSIHEERPDRSTRNIEELEMKTLTDIGTFRAINLTDLARQRYEGNLPATQQRIGNLIRKGLVQSRTSFPDRAVYVALTKMGHQILASRSGVQPTGQRFHHGFVKTREARHDAALYRLFQEEAKRIENRGGTIRRVRLDFELKESLNRKLARLRDLPESERAAKKAAIAREHGLTVVKGKIPLPDLRLEYETPEQQMGKVDLELVTGHYHHDNIATKAKAGFAMFVMGEDAPRLRPAAQDPEIMQDLFSL